MAKSTELKPKDRDVKKNVREAIEEYDGWAEGSVHVVTSKGVFPFSVLKAETQKKQKVESKQIKLMDKWIGENGLVPYPFAAGNLLRLKDNCGYFDASVKQIAKDVVGQGFKIELIDGKKENEKEKDKILNFIENSGGDRDETFLETLERGIIDWGFIGWWGWEVSRDDKKEVNGMWHVPAQTFFIHKDREKFAQKRDDRTMWFKKYGVEGDISAETGEDITVEQAAAAKEDETKIIEKAHELIYYINYYTDSDYYGAPNILSSVGAVLGFIGARDFNLAFFENYGIPAALIILKGRWDKETAKKISDFIDVELKGADQSHKTMCIHPHKDSEFEYIQLGVDVKEGSFKIYQKMVRDEILMEYKMPPYKLNIAEVGSLGGTTAPELNKNYAQSVIVPLEKVVERIITKDIFQKGLNVHSYRFDLNEIDTRDLDAIVERDVKLFGIGARTSNQILNRLGIKPYPEGDRYYVSTTFVEVGEDTIEKQAAVLEAVELVVKEKPELAAEIMKIAKKEVKK
jgi:hypothetical protein